MSVQVLLVVDCCPSVVGCWLLVVAQVLLVVGCCPSVVGVLSFLFWLSREGVLVECIYAVEYCVLFAVLWWDPEKVTTVFHVTFAFVLPRSQPSRTSFTRVPQTTSLPWISVVALLRH